METYHNSWRRHYLQFYFQQPYALSDYINLYLALQTEQYTLFEAPNTPERLDAIAEIIQLKQPLKSSSKYFFSLDSEQS